MFDSKLSKTALYSILVTFIASLIMFFINIVLANILSDEDFGKYTIIRTSIILFPLIIFFGIGNSLIRLHKRQSVFNYNWREPIKKAVFYASITCVPFILIFDLRYNLSYTQNILLFFSCILLGRVMLSATLLRISEKYILSQIIKNLWRAIYLIILFFFLAFNFPISIDLILLIIFLAILGVYLEALYKEKNIPIGSNKIRHSKIVGYGFMFFLLGSSDVFLSQFDKFLIGSDLSVLGRYNAISILPFTVFNITASSIGTILMPYIINNSDSFNRYKRYTYIFCIIIIPVIIYLFMRLTGTYIVDMVYPDKYSNIDDLFFYCNILGAIQYLQVLAYFLIGATLSDKTIKIITILNLIIILFTYPIYNLFGSGDNLINAVVCFILIWGLRFLISAFFLLRTNIKSDKF